MPFHFFLAKKAELKRKYGPLMYCPQRLVSPSSRYRTDLSQSSTVANGNLDSLMTDWSSLSPASTSYQQTFKGRKRQICPGGRELTRRERRAAVRVDLPSNGGSNKSVGSVGRIYGGIFHSAAVTHSLGECLNGMIGLSLNPGKCCILHLV